MPRVSVIIPTYNRAHLIGETIESVLSQTFDDYEIIVIDDGSTDATEEVVRGYGGPIKYFYQENRGLARSRNRGIEISSGEYLQFLDSDDLLLPRAIERKVSLLDSNSNLGFVYTAYQYINREGEILPWPDSIPICQLRRGRVFRFLIRFNFIQISTILARRDCINKVGLFDPSFEAGEDWDWELRMSSEYEIDYDPEVLGLYRRHGDNWPETAMEAGLTKVTTKYLSDERTRRMLGDDWREIYFDHYVTVAHYHYNRRNMATARKYYFKALGARPAMAGDLNIFSLILKSCLGDGARNLAKRAREKFL